MLLLVSIALVSVLGGALLGIWGRRRAFSALSTFALVAALAVVLAQLLPDALAGAGLWALLVFAIGAIGPTMLERVGAKLGAKDGWGLELGYWALVAHKVADGIGLGTYGGGHHAEHDHVAILVAIAAHTVPVVALVTLVYHRRGGMRSVLWRIGLLALATIGGVFIPALVPATSFEASEPWITAAVAGLLMHVVAHDWQPEHGPPKGRTQRLTDIIALGLGLALVLLGGGEHHHSEGAGDVREEMGHALIDLALSTAPALLIGLTIGALLTAFSQKLPTAWLRRGNAFSQALRGAVVGAPLPICACGVLPLAESLRRRGAGAALVVAFLLATPELGVETFALTARFMGWPFAFVRLGAAVGLAMIAAMVMHRFAKAASPEGHAHDHDDEPKDDRPFLQRFTAGFDELLYHIAPWTVVGLIGAAYVQAVMPSEAMGSMSDFGLDVLVITLVSVPSYVCAASATPLAAVLLAKGISPGAVLVGLLLGPATNLATIGFLRKTFGSRATWIGVGVLVLAAWAMAGVVNVVGVPMSLAAPGAEAHEHGLLSLLTGGVLAAALFRSVWLSGLRPWLGSLSEGLGGHHHHHHHDHHHHGHHHPHGHHHHHGHHHDHDHHDHDHGHDHHHHDDHEPAGG